LTTSRYPSVPYHSRRRKTGNRLHCSGEFIAVHHLTLRSRQRVGVPQPYPSAASRVRRRVAVVEHGFRPESGREQTVRTLRCLLRHTGTWMTCVSLTINGSCSPPIHDRWYTSTCLRRFPAASSWMGGPAPNIAVRLRYLSVRLHSAESDSAAHAAAMFLPATHPVTAITHRRRT